MRVEGVRMRVYPAFDWWLPLLLTFAVAGSLAFVVSIACAMVATSLEQRDGRTSRGHEWRRVIRTSRRFADLVAVGDFEAAEAAIAEASRYRVVEWDERAVLDLSLDEARRELTEPGPAANWFPEARRTARHDVVAIVLDREEPIQLTIVSENWTPDLDGMMFEATTGAFSILGSLSLRTMVIGIEDAGLRTTVEVVVHMEANDGPEARAVLTRARTITRDGLARLAASLSPS